MSRSARSRKVSAEDHQDWLALVGISGPFLALPVLTRVWPTLAAVDPDWWPKMRAARMGGDQDPDYWIEFLLRRLCGWGDQFIRNDLGHLRIDVPEHSTTVEPDFALVERRTDVPKLLGMTLKPGQHPTTRPKSDAWPATPVDRIARLCRHHDVPLGLVTNGRWFALVVAPPQSVTSTAIFDTATWPESSERTVIRAFYSLLERRRFFGVPEGDKLPALLRESLERQAEVTGVLGVQVRQAVEMLVRAISWHDLHAIEPHRPGLAHVPSHDVYRAAVTMVIRVVFLLYAEERRLLPADNDLYAASYSVRHLAERLEIRSQEASEQDLEHSRGAWLQLLALSEAIHSGVVHERLRLPTYDGPMFDPGVHPWLAEVWIDDRTVLHLLKAIRYVVLGRELRRLSFRALGVEQIGHVYEMLLAYDAKRSSEVMLGVEWAAGKTAEVALTDLERHDRPAGTPRQRAETLIGFFAKPGDKAVGGLGRRLDTYDQTRAEAMPLLYAASGGDRELTGRVLPYLGILRRDLRGMPLVVAPGALYMTASQDRSMTGAHYTPPEFASEVVDGALDDLAYRPGPRETADRSQWRVRPGEELLDLRIADIAVGSGAFLVAACRYLAQRLVEAWAEDGDRTAAELVEAVRQHGPPDDVEADPLVIRARRTIIERCLFGVDINPMATEIARLSLWLIALDPAKPFNFLDHHIVVGDSMIGIHSLGQLRELHFDESAGRRLRGRWLGDPSRGVRDMVADLVRTRRELAEQPDDSLTTVVEKSRKWRRVLIRTSSAMLIADLVSGAMIKNAGRPESEMDDDVVAVAELARRVTAELPGAVEQAREVADRWLSVEQPHGKAPRLPLHWPLVFADIFDRGGFDAVVGNQPYLGGQGLTGVLGRRYRELLVRWVGGGVRGSADLVAYFVVRSHDLVKPDGVTALIATNTLSQGDSREVSLDRLLDRGVTIRRATKSRPWPTSSVSLNVCIVHTSRRPTAPNAAAELDGRRVSGITSSLDVRSRVTGTAYRIAENARLSFIGSYVLGLGFTMSPEEGRALIEKDERNRDVLFPYINGQDLNSRPDCSGSRYVINFHDWPEDRARSYPDCYDQVLRLVKPERDRNSRKVRRERWWQFAEQAPNLYRAIAGLTDVLVIARVSKTVMPVRVPTGQVVSEMVVVFATDDTAMLALLSSAPHYWWAVTHASSMRSDLRYTPSDVFETFARPEPTVELRRLGERLDDSRRQLMLARRAGLTSTYNLVHDKGCHDDDIAELRKTHVDIDGAVIRAYGWDDMVMDHDFHDTRQGMRYTVSPAAQQEILDRLLELNHARHADERRGAAGRLPRQLRLGEDSETSASLTP
ncbi:Eco57I restriction-modification methylase domain-containing protein [Actinoplanes sp. CA-030573]|uniref:Eco57I restriction-modification methylase domain-containing protein n=1 Tax=Actinoplanes sp. CA-030573 TaxID=3239898 RepID=UPI003D8E3802